MKVAYIFATDMAGPDISCSSMQLCCLLHRSENAA